MENFCVNQEVIRNSCIKNILFIDDQLKVYYVFVKV